MVDAKPVVPIRCLFQVRFLEDHHAPHRDDILCVAVCVVFLVVQLYHENIALLILHNGHHCGHPILRGD